MHLDMKRGSLTLALVVGLLSVPAAGVSQSWEVIDPPDRALDEGEGPFERLIIRGATVIDGAGSPPVGPVDIVIERNRIVDVRRVGYPDVPIDPAGRPGGATREIDAHGSFVLPGFVDLHAHFRRRVSGAPAEYILKLWLAHGVTTIREAGSNDGVDFTLRLQERSARNEVAAPRIFVYARPGVRGGWPRDIRDPADARDFVRWSAENGVDGIKLGAYGPRNLDPDVMEALVDEAKRQGIGTTAHLHQTGVARMNARDVARLGVGSLNHWYGLPEALFTDRRVEAFPPDYNYQNEQHRFAGAGRLWKQAAPPWSEAWNRVMDELIELNLTLVPTFTIYEASRDLMRARNADWHDRYTLPDVWQNYQPNPEAHGSYWFYWTSTDEAEWRRNYQIWMAFVNEFKNRGGRVCTGSDVGLIYKLYGFDYIRELELLHEAGFHPLEVIEAATLCGAQTIMEPLGRPIEFGIVRPGMLADLVVVRENPLENLKVLYGTGVERLNLETRQMERVGGIQYTIKDGIIYDAKQLLADVARMVEEAKSARHAERSAHD